MPKNNEDIQKGEIIQAVIIADSFDSKFGPLTTTKPRCLMPLGDRAILGYTLDFLQISEVQECFVFCTSFAQDIKNYLKEWTDDQDANVMTITPITNESCRSFGDAMRDLDAQGVLRQDFILLFGDCVGNINLSSVLQEHKQRSKDDKNATMTLVYRKAMPGHHLRTIKNEVFLAVTEEKRILYHSRPGEDQQIKVPLEMIDENDIVNFKFDLLDLGIAICTQAVPPLFADNFDCQTLDEFIIGVLQDDLTDNTLHMHELAHDGYAARINDYHKYFGVHHDLLHRWLYPIVPEIASGKTPAQLVYSRHNIYKGKNVDLRTGSRLEQDVLVAHGSQIGENSTLFKAVIGQNTQLGKDVCIRDCIIGGNVTIGDGCNLTGCVIGNNVVIGNKVSISPRCVLGDGVQIQDNVQLPPETWLVSQKPDSGFSDEEEEEVTEDEKNYGPKAILFKDEDEDDEEDSDNEIEGIESRWGLINLECDDDGNEDDSDSDSEIFPDIDHEIENEFDPDARFNKFRGEAHESLLRGFKEGIKVDNLVLEINSSRHAYAVDAGQVIQSVLSSILEIASSEVDSENEVQLNTETKKCLKNFNGVLKNYIKSPVAQRDCLSSLKSFVLENSHFLPIIAQIIHELYDQEILSDDSILEWYENLSESKIKEHIRLKKFIEWLEEDEEEDEDESDESSSDED